MPTKTKKPTEKKKSIKKVEEEQIQIVTPGGKYFYANGKRKTAISRVRLYKGKGAITINNKASKEYFALKSLINSIKYPLKLTGTDQKFDVIAKVEGGGINSQADAIRHGISKSLVEAEPLLRPTLKKAGLLTRDSRVKERKKFGLKRARKGPQFSKR
ncbi:30S ribosomal protein S9 [Candidatus Peregrinibacteria bacterium]|nr:30S ribosomal protein S9 [Candidatus Peregrinibacteria bacterium]